MSVYSGFSTRKLESNYMSTTYQLMEFLSATLIKYRQILQNFKKKDDNLAEFLQVNQLEFQLIFNRLYYSLVKLEESKYMEPKFSLSTKALKKYLENQTSAQQMKKIEENNQNIQETDQIDKKQRPFSSNTNKFHKIFKKQDSSQKEFDNTDTLKNSKVIQNSQSKENQIDNKKQNNLAFQKGRSLTQNQSNGSKINLNNRNKQNQQKKLNDFQQVDQQDNILFKQSSEQQQNIRKKRISIQLTPQTSKNNSSIQKIKQGEQQEQQDQHQNQKLILYQPCSQNSSQLDKNNDNYTKNFSNNFQTDNFQGKDQQSNKNLRYKRNFQQKQIQVPLDDKQNISSTKNKDFLIKYKRTSSEHQIQDTQFIQSNQKQVKLQLQKQQELEEQLKRDQQYLAQIQQQKHLYQLQQNQKQQYDINEEQQNNNQQLYDSKNNFQKQSSNLNKGKHQQIYKSIDNLKGNIQSFQSTFELIKQVKDENETVTGQKSKKNNYLFEEQKLGLQTPQRIGKQKLQQQNQIIQSDIQDQNQINNNNNPSKNYSDDGITQLQNIQIQKKLQNKHVIVYSNPNNMNIGRKKINSCDYRNTNSVQSSSQKRNDFKNLYSSQSKQIPNISFLDIDNQYSKEKQKHNQLND
ncbi:hypothetical protein PPERSA_06203 [Pseudocohnilembus persalinus]|uniref:Uncharacterized protein n=1 Tax=Pseudocohnilembus persalinus TaxID=266149 RepID=A0A0V0R0G9_PSEPJ|nr:hypothetical protein PPERSA_06203 [Pseudocohnilembus persalinus]|eukprot:KRX08025.1 hypothetical protein PPERSA_06203 [Pseudocohnilembus persalinus]